MYIRSRLLLLPLQPLVLCGRHWRLHRRVRLKSGRVLHRSMLLHRLLLLEELLLSD